MLFDFLAFRFFFFQSSCFFHSKVAFSSFRPHHFFSSFRQISCGFSGFAGLFSAFLAFRQMYSQPPKNYFPEKKILLTHKHWKGTRPTKVTAGQACGAAGPVLKKKKNKEKKKKKKPKSKILKFRPGHT